MVKIDNKINYGVISATRLEDYEDEKDKGELYFFPCSVLLDNNKQVVCWSKTFQGFEFFDRSISLAFLP